MCLYGFRVKWLALSCQIQWNMQDAQSYPDSKVHGANMGSTWGRQDPGRSCVGPMKLAIWIVCLVVVQHDWPVLDYWWFVWLLLTKYVPVTSIWVNIGSGNSLLPDSLTEPVLTYFISKAKWHSSKGNFTKILQPSVGLKIIYPKSY